MSARTLVESENFRQCSLVVDFENEGNMQPFLASPLGKGRGVR